MQKENKKAEGVFRCEGEVEVEISDNPKNLIEYEDFASIEGEEEKDD